MVALGGLGVVGLCWLVVGLWLRWLVLVLWCACVVRWGLVGERSWVHGGEGDMVIKYGAVPRPLCAVEGRRLWWVCGGLVLGLWWACGGHMVGLWWACVGPMVGLWWACGGMGWACGGMGLVVIVMTSRLVFPGGVMIVPANAGWRAIPPDDCP